MAATQKLPSLSLYAPFTRLSLRLFSLLLFKKPVKDFVALLNNCNPSPSVPIKRFPLLSSVIEHIFFVFKLPVLSSNRVKELLRGLYRFNPPLNVPTHIFLSWSSKITQALLQLKLVVSAGSFLKCL